MRSKFINHLLLIANVLFIFGLVLTIIILSNNYKNQQITQANQIIVAYIPFMLFMFFSMITAAFFVKFRYEYFISIKMHLTKKTVAIYKSSIYLLFWNIFLAIVMMFTILFFINLEQVETMDFFVNVYLYIILGLEMALTMVDVVLDALSKLKIKVDLAIRRSGIESFLGEKSHEQ